MIDFAEFKKFFLFNLIGALIISALVAVITVLIGEFGEVAGKVMLTLLMVVIHSLVSLLFIWNDEKQNTFERFNLFTNVLFLLIVISFLTSIFGIWEIITGQIVIDTYQTFIIFLFASLHVDILSKALDKENYLDFIIYLNYIFILGVVLMLVPVFYVSNPMIILGEIYFRILAALAIIDGTLSILTIIFYRLYMHKNPKEEDELAAYTPEGTPVKEKNKGMSIWVWILIIYLLLQVVLPFFFFGFMRFLF